MFARWALSWPRAGEAPIPDRRTLAAVDSLIHTFVQEHQRTGANASRSHGRYVVARYACPVRLGNMLHNFINAFALAVVTNRTLLWAYSTRSGLRKGVALDQCAHVLQRAPWIPAIGEHKIAQTLCPHTVEEPCEVPTTHLTLRTAEAWMWLASCPLPVHVLSVDGKSTWVQESAAMALARDGEYTARGT